MEQNSTNNTTQYVARPPIITIMGHVDHGKTSLLDAIRHTNVIASEHGGITQHIGAYQIEHNSHKLTFIDTPGHAAFAQMRARGGRASDIVILVVSAEEGVKPQTQEAIKHARAAGVPIVVAFTKVDLPSADVQKVKQELASENIVVEDWGGDIVSVEVSAKTGQNLDKLLDSLIAISEVTGIKANPTGELEAIIIESHLDRKKGVVVSAIVKNGTLRVGDKATASGHVAAIKSLLNDKGESLKTAGPSTPVEILGFSKVPNVGDLIVQQGSELAQLALDEHKVEIIGKDTKKVVSIVLKTDTQGTLEAVKASLSELVTENVAATYSLKFLISTTGDITDSDVLLCQSTKGIVVGFNVRVPGSIQDLADSLAVTIKTYKTIYELVDELKAVLEGTASFEESKIKGRAEVLKTFKLESGDIIAGCKVIAGALKEGSKIAIYTKNPADLTPEDLPIFNGAIKKLKKGKDEVKLVGKDVECGILLKPQFDAIDGGQWIEVR